MTVVVTLHARAGTCTRCKLGQRPIYDRSRRLCASCTVKELTTNPGDAVAFETANRRPAGTGRRQHTEEIVT